jgi:hypothetical protein
MGIVLAPVWVPLKPNDVVAFGESEPLKLTFVTDMAAPFTVRFPFHSCEMVWPLANVQFTRQPVIACAPEFRTVMFAPKFPGHVLVIEYVAAHERVPDDVVDEVGVGVGVGVADRVGVGVAVAERVGVVDAVGVVEPPGLVVVYVTGV